MNNSYKHENRLINEKSPYLQQHAHNPVDWYPWCDEAFEKAERENKPIFLSIGYSSCHWCHVMERESFEDEEVASILNKYFVSIKVDREERPDVDQVYMNVCQAMTGSGGWPLSLFLTEHKKPIHAGTYYPKESNYGRKGFKDLLLLVANKWRKEKEELVEATDKLFKDIERHVFVRQAGELSEAELHKGFAALKQSFDKTYGGFGTSPKFPTTHNLSFLLKYYKVFNNDEALNIVVKTLEQIYKGGIYDHIGYGFCRYSTDEKWLVPHFEKMLYDNALLTSLYTEAYEATGNELFKEIVENTITYLNRDMKDASGGYYSAEDADSEGIEGKFYVWSPEEILSVLGEETGKHFNKTYDISEGGNFEGSSIPNLIDGSLVEAASLKPSVKAIFEKREERIHPFKDRKVLMSWNALANYSLAYAGRIFDEPKYVEAAEANMEFLLSNLTDSEGRLMVRYFDGDVAHKGYIDDYAFIVNALTELYSATFKPKYLAKAIELADDMITLFNDEEMGGFFTYGSDSESLIVRPKEIYDGAIPSGNAVAAVALLKLSSYTFNYEYKDLAIKTINSFGNDIKSVPSAYTMSLTAMLSQFSEGREYVICGERDDEKTKAVLKKINSQYSPFTTVILLEKDAEEHYKINPALKDYKKENEETTVYLCKNNSCQRLPVSSFI